MAPRRPNPCAPLKRGEYFSGRGAGGDIFTKSLAYMVFFVPAACVIGHAVT